MAAWLFFGFLIILLATTFWHGKDTLVGKQKIRRLCFFRILFFGAYGEKVIKESLRLEGVELSLERLKDLVIKTRYLGDRGDFCASAFDMAHLVDSLHIGCT